MGTSSSGGGAGGRNPLIPRWIPSGGGDTGGNDSGGNDTAGNDGGQTGNDAGQAGNAGQGQTPVQQGASSATGAGGNRYRQPRSDFNKYLRSRGSNTGALRSALRGYGKNAAGSTSNMAKRMAPSASRVASFYSAVNTIRTQGTQRALQQFQLVAYTNKPMSDILSALFDEIFRERGGLYENTQDDSITKLAYANTVVKLCEMDGIDLDALTNENVEVMMAVFIEETIAQRVINDIGNNLTTTENNIATLLDIENNVYQVVNGLVRTQIMPEVIATQRGDGKDIERKIENIYRIAFDAMVS